MWQTVAQFFVVLAFGAAGFACSSACDTSDEANDPVRYEAGTAVNGIYASSSAHEGLLPFPGGKRYDIVHHLGFEPLQVQLYWSFRTDGIGWDAQSDGKSSLTLATGNSAIIQLKNAEFIRVKNDSCVEYALLVLASGDPRPRDVPVDAGAE
ncbi:MAG TPA: hypothetical protein VK550_01265 [Polyangiaceae bacterium]|nr:hypothetical protein [Polyangiaceae bacterium]